MRRNNMWNRIFHNKEIKRNIVECNKFLTWNNQGQYFLDAIGKAISLYRVLAIHRDAWGTGFQNNNLGSCSYGMFRTENIPTMKPEEIFLGGIWGLFTHAIPFWEERKSQPCGCNGFGIDPEISLYSIILDQYKNLLISNIDNIWCEAEKALVVYKKAGYLK